MGYAYVTLMVLGFMILNPVLSSAAQTCRSDIAASTKSSRFTVHGDGTVADSLTGLTWKRCSEGRSGNSCENGTAVTLDWEGAQKTAASSTFAGKKDWRLPTMGELDSIVEYQCTMPAVNATVFPATPAANFWSASPYAGYANAAWNLNFNDGVHDSCSKNFQLYLRLVRGGK